MFCMDIMAVLHLGFYLSKSILHFGEKIDKTSQVDIQLLYIIIMGQETQHLQK